MNDGLTKEMSAFLFNLEKIGEESLAIAKKTIDDAVKRYENDILLSVPVRTGELKKSFKVEKVTGLGSNFYGYKAEFIGTNENGESNAKVANILNYGNQRIAGSHFIDKATKKLKGLSQKIEDNIIDNMEVKTNGNDW